MKLANRIFLFFGALSVISFVQFNAMAKCSETPDAGEYCDGTSVKDCIPGCYCIGGNKNAVGVTENNLKNFCTEKQSASTNQTDKMNQAGIYLCSNSAQFSKEKAVSSLDCKDVEWCNKQPDSGKYCERKYKTSGSGSVIKFCPDGCWCEGKAKGKKAVGILNPFSSTGADTIPLVAWCGRTGSNRVHNLESYLNDRGVHYCPDDFPHSDSASEKITNCYAKANDTGGFGKMYYGQVTCAPGRFLRKGTDQSGICIQCTSGFYCEGGTFIVSYKEDQGIESCPSGYSSGPAATRITDCKNARGQNYVAPVTPSGLAPVTLSGLSEINHVNVSLAGDLSVLHCPAGGKYWNGNECDDCPPGSYCPANDDQPHACTGTRKYSTAGASVCSTCSMAQRANSDHTGCITAPVLPTSEEVARQRIEPNDLVAHEALCVDSQSHKVYFLPGAVDADGTMNPVYKCTGNTVKLPISDFTRDGYQFDEWNCNHNIGDKAAGATFLMPDADVNCTAQWTSVPAGTYTVQYACGEGTGSAPIDTSSPYISGGTAIALSN
ncbi:MAG: InlB B-repeat-containing protein, partial [Alphaproteobacteria bacterium]|nr:InlB B-repeat-containing protein [Alphaproteobacteria bacterium]